ncbi:MAG: SDR family oxidoreductase [Acidimicrobiia bacterium]|nr:SDR family oxidoreductase [Acidimicrobiia bacterium]
MDLFDLDGKVAVVTGGNRGIGLGIAEGLAAAGATVAIWSRDAARNTAAAASLGSGAGGFVCDVTDPDSVEAAMEATVARFGKVDVLFANAGIGSAARFQDLDEEEWQRVLDADLSGVYRVVRAVVRHLQGRGEGGSIVLTASVFGSRGLPYSPHYSAAKGGVVNLGRSLAIFLARDRIRVNVLSPGWVATEMTESTRGHEKSNAATIERTPMRRWGEPADFAGPAVFLASDASRFMTGAELVIDGGFSAG